MVWCVWFACFVCAVMALRRSADEGLRDVHFGVCPQSSRLGAREAEVLKCVEETHL